MLLAARRPHFGQLGRLAVLVSLFLAVAPSVYAQTASGVFQGEVTVTAVTGASTTVTMPIELVRDVSAYREIVVRYRVSKTSGMTATATKVTLQTAMSLDSEDEWMDVGTGISLTSSTQTPALDTEAIDVTGDPPLMRYVRWLVTFDSGVSSTALVRFSIDIIGHR